MLGFWIQGLELYQRVDRRPKLKASRVLTQPVHSLKREPSSPEASPKAGALDP